MLSSKFIGVAITVVTAGAMWAATGDGSKAPPAEEKAMFSYAGDIVDEKGKPVVGADVIASHRSLDGRSFGYIDSVRSDVKGHFKIDRDRALSGAFPATTNGEIIRLEFHHPDYAYGRLEDLNLLTRDQATHLTARLREGRCIEGRVLDPKRQPVAGVAIEVHFNNADEQRHGGTTDAKGHFRIQGLPSLFGYVEALTVERNQSPMTGHGEIDTVQTNAGDMVLMSIELPPAPAVHELFGMKLLDVNAAVQKAFHLQRSEGVVILDPGPDVERLNLGRLQRGDEFLMIGETFVRDFNDFRTKLSAAVRAEPKGKIRIVYQFKRPDAAGSNTRLLELSEEDVAGLMK